MELKWCESFCIGKQQICSNRTFMELKCLPVSRQIRGPQVLIVPLWN